MYRSTFSENAIAEVLGDAHPVADCPGLMILETNDPTERKVCSMVESPAAFKVMLELHDLIRDDFVRILWQRDRDAEFIDTRTAGFVEANRTAGTPWESRDYSTVIGVEDTNGRIVVGFNVAKTERSPGMPPQRKVTDPLRPQVVLSRPGADGKRALNSMNAPNRRVPNESHVAAQLVKETEHTPVWCADCAEGLTPSRHSIARAALRFRECMTYEASHVEMSGRVMTVSADDIVSRTAKRVVGVAVPCPFLFRRPSMWPAEPIPLIVYDLVLHMANNARRPETMVFYLTKIENEEEAVVSAKLIRKLEELTQKHIEPLYRPGTAKIIVSIDSARAIYRLNEIAVAFGDLFAGFIFSWQTFTSSVASLFKRDPGFSMPPVQDTVLARNMLRSVHSLIVAAARKFGGVAISGLFPELPVLEGIRDVKHPSFQVCMKRFLLTAIASLGRGFDGFGVSDPLYVRYGLAVVEAHERVQSGRDKDALDRLVRTLLLSPDDQSEVLSLASEFAAAKHLIGQLPAKISPRELFAIDLSPQAVRYRAMASDPKLRPQHLEKIRHKSFIALQCLVAWFTELGMSAMLAPHPCGHPLRRTVTVTILEAFRWDLWRMVHVRGTPLEDVVAAVFAAQLDIKRGVKRPEIAVRVPYSDKTRKWYNVATNIWLRVIADPEPPARIMDLMTLFCMPSVRQSPTPWRAVRLVDPIKFGQPPVSLLGNL